MRGKNHVTQEFKFDVSDEGTFEGMLATYNNVDLGGDTIEPGAFQKTLSEKSSVPLLWQHDTKLPIGTLTLIDTPTGLAVKGTIWTDTQIGDYAYKTVKRSVISGLSIGYDTVKSVWEGSVRKLKELRLWEGSIVTFPMDPHALIASVKAAREAKDDFSATLSEMQLLSGGGQIIDALSCALNSVLWDGSLSVDTRMETSRASIQQFTDAYLNWLPEFLGWMQKEYNGDFKAMTERIAERKEGRRISADNKTTLRDAHGQISGALEKIRPLFDEAGDDTTSEKAAGQKPEPDLVHSAADEILSSIRSLIPAA